MFSLLADSLPYVTSGSTSTAGSLDSGFYIDNGLGSSDIIGDGYYGGTAAEIPFTITLSLPSVSDYTLDSASLSFTGTDTYGFLGDSTSSSPVGTYSYTGTCYDAFFNDYYSCPLTSSQYDAAEAEFYGGSEPIFTGVSDGSVSANIDTTGGDLNLAALGFGNDLLTGGTLTLTGYQYVYVSGGEIDYSGFNANTDLYFGVSGDASQSATLSLDGMQATPEPRWGILLLAGLFTAAGYRFRAKRVNA
jgi:hypothetical protein